MDAFAVLMAPRRTERFALRFGEVPRPGDGTWGEWSWSWGHDVVGPVMWSAVVSHPLCRGMDLQLTTTLTGAGVDALRSPPRTRLPVNWLVSALQKNVRRMRGPSAVRVVAEILRRAANPLEGLRIVVRRLVIIMVEDAVVHPAVPLAVWTMLAMTRDYVPPDMLLGALLRVVWEVAQVPLREDSAYAPPLGDLLHPPSTRVVGGAKTHIDRAFARCLLVRAEYGGMKGDVTMLRRCARSWEQRLKTDSRWHEWLRRTHHHTDDPCGDFPPIEWLQIAPLVASDIPLAALDFHCTDITTRVIRRVGVSCLRSFVQLQGLSTVGVGDVVRQAIWQHRSSVNYRAPLHEQVEMETPPPKRMKHSSQETILTNVWQRIEPSVTAETLLMRSKFV